VLQLLKNLYGQKQAGGIWYLWLTERLKRAGFKQSKIDPCVFYYKGNVLLIYVDDTIILGPTTQGIEEILTKLRSQFNIDDGGDMSDYLGVKVMREKDGTIHLTQPHLIESILRDLHLLDIYNKQATTRSLPALTTKILHPDASGTPFVNSTFHYRSIIGKLNFLEKSTRPDLAYTVHQCARFVERPTMLHVEAVKRIGRYLLGTADKGLILRPTKENTSFDCWVDASRFTRRVHTIILPNAYYSPAGKYKLLCPQHWAQAANDHYPYPNGTWCATYSDRIILHWAQGQHTRTLRLMPSTNMGILITPSGINQYQRACHVMERLTQPVVPPTLIEPIDENIATTHAMPVSPVSLRRLARPVTPELGSDVNLPSHEPSDIPTVDPSTAPRQAPIEEPSTDPRGIHHDNTVNTHFDLSLFQEEDVSEPHPGLSRDEQEMMLWHLRLSHLPLSRLLSMARLNLLPRRLLNVKKLFCSGCAFGRMTRRPWRTKVQPNVIIKTPECLGECVSVDQLDSSVPGFIAQLKGIPTHKRYNAARVFVDNYSSLSYIHLQKDLTSAETIKAKEAFEAYAKSYNVTIQHFHADNGRFADNTFRQSCQEKQQTISFCGVNAHWQNGVAEKRIRDLQDAATTSLLYAQCRWPDAIEKSLWPYALRHVNNKHNNTPLRGRKYSPLELFANILIAPQLRHFHHFGAPACVLNNNSQQGQKAKKWEQRARIGVYLRQSMQHARTIMLVLSLQSGNVSPQYHCQIDDSFSSVMGKHTALVPASEWQLKAKLKTGKF